MRPQNAQSFLLPTHILPWSVLCALAAAIPSPASFAADAAATAPTGAAVKSKPVDPWGLPAKPAWLTDLSMSVREGYDDNVYATGVDPLQHHASFFTAVSPKIGVNFAPLINGSAKSADGLETLSLGYAGDYTWYGNAGSEDNQAHNIPAVVKGKYGAFSYNFDNAFKYVDGSDKGIAYPTPAGATSGNSAYATAILRERREQIQDRTKITFRYDFDKVFIRPVGTLLYYDLMTDQLSAAEIKAQGKTGYQNYVDRYDINGGADFGYKINKDLAATIGYRYGSQYQDKVQAVDLDASNEYNRVLFGLEGKPLSWLKFEAAVGPDFRQYTANSGFTDTDLTRVYADAGFNIAISDKDAMVIKYKRWEWVSSTGKAAYEDSSYDLNYKRKVTSKLGLELGVRASESNYHAPTVRDDWMYTLSAGARYAFNSHLSADVDYSVDLGRNGIENLASEYAREFNRQLVALTLRVKY